MLDRESTVLSSNRTWSLILAQRESSNHAGIGFFDTRQVTHIITVLSSCIAVGMLAGSIWALYAVESTVIRLGLVFVFIVVFAAMLNVLTTASRDAIFAATAGFAAVLVVFLSRDTRDGCSC